MRVNSASLMLRGVLVILAAVAAKGGTVTAATGANNSLATAQLITAPYLVIDQVPPNYTYGTAQPVSPQYYAADVLGSITSGTPQEFFSVAATPGQNINVQVNSTGGGPAQPTELLLYDPNGNLVAIASGNGTDGLSSVIDFTVPSGDGGNWTAEVTSPSSTNFNYDLRVTSPFTYTTIVNGRFINPNDPGFYAVNANAGDQLLFSAVSTQPLHTPDELLLYDANGNLVAIANGNGSDGASSVIDFTVPSGDAGLWEVEVAGSASAPNPNSDLFRYYLTIQGDTGTGPINPFAPPSFVPEPAFYGLLGASLAGLAFIRRLKTRRERRGQA